MRGVVLAFVALASCAAPRSYYHDRPHVAHWTEHATQVELAAARMQLEGHMRRVEAVKAALCAELGPPECP